MTYNLNFYSDTENIHRYAALLLEFDIKTSNFYSISWKPRALCLKTSNFYVLKLKTSIAPLENHIDMLHYCWNLKIQISISEVENNAH